MHQQYPAFSVLMPVYGKDNANYFTTAIESLLHQSVPPSEIVIVEDGPIPEELAHVIQHYKTAHSNCIKTLQLAQNMGMGVAMNTGLHACSYEFVARMDADDICRPNRFELQLDFLLANPIYDVVGGIIEEFDQKIGDLQQYRRLPVAHPDIFKFAQSRNPINHMTVLFKKQKAIDAGGYWSRRYFEDYNLWYQMLIQGCVFYNLPQVLVDVRIGNNMIARRKGLAYFKNELPLFLSMYKSRFISIPTLVVVLFGRLLSRLMPLYVLQIVYKFFLRKRHSPIGVIA